MNLSDEEYQLRKERGKRSKIIREQVLGLSRSKLCRKYNVALSTWQTWENVDLGGMAESAAKKLVDIYKAEGATHISVEWLMYGTGKAPFLDNNPCAFAKDENLLQDTKSAILKELEIFYKHTQQAIHTIINDEAMSPWLMPGDYVAGEWFFGEKIREALDFPCIVYTLEGEILVRVLKAGNSAGQYLLIGTNTQAKINPFIKSNVKLISAAPILWIRKIKFAHNF